jgi:hypothetical protein
LGQDRELAPGRLVRARKTGASLLQCLGRAPTLTQAWADWLGEGLEKWYTRVVHNRFSPAAESPLFIGFLASGRSVEESPTLSAISTPQLSPVSDCSNLPQGHRRIPRFCANSSRKPQFFAVGLEAGSSAKLYYSPLYPIVRIDSKNNRWRDKGCCG